jgi:hypothetical protein
MVLRLFERESKFLQLWIAFPNARITSNLGRSNLFSDCVQIVILPHLILLRVDRAIFSCVNSSIGFMVTTRGEGGSRKMNLGSKMLQRQALASQIWRRRSRGICQLVCQKWLSFVFYVLQILMSWKLVTRVFFYIHMRRDVAMILYAYFESCVLSCKVFLCCCKHWFLCCIYVAMLILKSIVTIGNLLHIQKKLVASICLRS